MKFNRVLFFVLLASLAVFLSGCSGAQVASNWPGIAVDDKNAYLSDAAHVYVVKLSDGTDATTQTTDGQVPLRFPLKADGKLSFYAAPVFTSDGQMIVGNAAQNNYLLYSVDPTTGNIKWTFGESSGLWLANVLVSGNFIYAPGGNGTLYALDLKGQKRWGVAVSKHSLWSAPVTDGKLVYIATLDHDVIALDPESGAQRWKVTLDNAILGAPAVSADGTLYLGTLSKLYALSTADGSQKWTTAIKDNLWSTPTVNGEILYIGTSFAKDGNPKAGKLYAVNATNGQVIWAHDEESSIIASPLVLSDQVVYVTETGHIQSLNLDGAPKWQADIDKAKILTAPVLAGDTILVVPMQSSFLLAAYNLTGAQKWTFTPAK
jgi:outer membrane protein assembly factor BamB